MHGKKDNSRLKKFSVLGLFLILTSVFLFPIFFGKTFFPGDILHQLPPWSLSGSGKLKEILPLNNPLLGDPVTAFYPWYTFIGQAIKAGFFPLWNPLVMTGAPFLANWQSGALALQNLVFYVFKTPLALNINVFLKIFLALSFSYLFLRKLNLSREASVFGAITYAFSAFFVVWLNWPQTRVAVWLPLILLTVEHLIEKPDLQRSGYFSLATAAAVFAGHPGTLVQVFIVTFVYSVFRIFADKEKIVAKSFYMLVGFSLGLGIGALMILPGFEMMKNSYQYAQRQAVNYLDIGLRPNNLGLLFFPYYYGNLRDGVYIGRSNFNEISSYLGLLPLFFSFWAFTFTLKLKRLWPALFLAMFSIIMIFGFWPQVLLYKLPLIAMQPTQRYIFILTFALSVLGAFGFDAFFGEHKRGKRFIILGLLFVAVLFALSYKMNPVIWDIYKKYYFLMPLPFLAMVGVYIKKSTAMLKKMVIGLLVFDLFIFGIALNSYVKSEYVYPENPITSFISKDKTINRTLPLVDTMMPNSMMPYNIHDLRGRDALMSKSLVEFSNLIKDRYSQPQLPNFILPNKIESQLIDFLNVKYIVSEIPAGNTLPIRLISSNGFAEVYKGTAQSQSFKAKDDNLAGVGVLIGTFKRPVNPTIVVFKLLDDKGRTIRQKKFKAGYFRDNSYYYFNFKPVNQSMQKKFTFVLEGKTVPKKYRSAVYLSTIDQYPDGEHYDNGEKQKGDLAFYLQYRKSIPKFKPVYKYKSLTVYENKKVFPRVFSVTDSIVIKSSAEARKYLQDPKTDLHKTVVLSKKPSYYGKKTVYKGKERVKIESYKANSIKITANLPSKKFIVISDSYDRGWKAYVDGEPASINLANTSFRAIAVNKGRHKIELDYKPDSFRRGLMISLSSFLLVIGFIVLPRIRKKDD